MSTLFPSMLHHGVLGPWRVRIFQSRSLLTSARYSSPRKDVGSLAMSEFRWVSGVWPYFLLAVRKSPASLKVILEQEADNNQPNPDEQADHGARRETIDNSEH